MARLGGRARINLFGPGQRTAPVARTVPQAFALDKKRLTAPFSAKRRNAPRHTDRRAFRAGRNGPDVPLKRLVAADAGKKMSHLLLLGLEVMLVFLAGFDFNGHALDDFETVAGEADDLLRVIRQKAQFVDAEIHEDLGACTIVPEIRREAEHLVGLHGIIALILQGVGADFVGEADAAPFLTHVHEAAASFLLDLAQGRAKLAAAVAAQGAQGIAGEALAVHAGKYGFGSGDVAFDQGEVRS